MRTVYKHFLIKWAISEGGSLIEVRTFLEGKYVMKVDAISQSAALSQQSTTIKNKDIWKFLDGLYMPVHCGQGRGVEHLKHV